MHPQRAGVPMAHRHPLERHQRDSERSVPSGGKRDSAHSLPHHLLRASPLVTHPITRYSNGKENKKADRTLWSSFLGEVNPQYHREIIKQML